MIKRHFLCLYVLLAAIGTRLTNQRKKLLAAMPLKMLIKA